MGTNTIKLPKGFILDVKPPEGYELDVKPPEGFELDEQKTAPRIPFSPGGAGFGVPAEVPGDLLEKSGIPEIFKGIRELVAPTTPYTEKEATQAYKDIPRILENAGMRVLTLGGLAGPLMGLKPSELRAALDEDVRDRAGFGPALAPALGETTLLAVEWGYIYPKMFAAVGATGRQIEKIPKVARGIGALKKMGGIEKVAEKYPRLVARSTRGLQAFTKGATVGTIRALPEALGEELPAGEVLKHVSKSAAIMGGVAATFQAVSEIDTALYIKNLRTSLIKGSNQRFAGHLAEVDNLPRGAKQSAAFKSLENLKRIELQNIDKIVSHAEAQLLGLKKGKLYQKGQEQVESPQKAAERMMRYGLEPGRAPLKGVEPLQKGLAKTEPFIQMPMTRVAEIVETSQAALKAARHPLRAAEAARAGKVRPTLPKAPAKVTPGPVRLDAIETEQQKRLRAQAEKWRAEADLREIDEQAEQHLKAIKAETPSTVGVQAPELAPEEKKEPAAAETPQIEDLGAEELLETVMSVEPLSADWVKAFNEMKRRKILETKKPAAATEKGEAEGVIPGKKLPKKIHKNNLQAINDIGGQAAKFLKNAGVNQRIGGPLDPITLSTGDSAKDGVEVTFKEIEGNDDRLIFDLLLVDESQRGKGIAGEVLDRIIKLADKTGVTLSGNIDIEGATRAGDTKGALSNKQMAAFLEKHGFTVDYDEEIDVGYISYKPPAKAKPTPIAEVSEELIPEVPAEPTPQKKELQQREIESERETTGISKRRRGQLLRESEKQIAADPVYQLEMEGVQDQVAEIGVGFYYVPPNLRSEVEDIIGKRKGFPTKLQKMFTFDPTENATDWEKAAQEGLGRGKEGIDETAGEMDITEFVQRVKDASERGKGLLDERRVDRARVSNNPYTQLLIIRRDMIAEGAADTQIDEMISAWAEHYGVEESVIENLFVGPEALKLKEIKELPEGEQDDAIEVRARQNVLRKERDEARESITDVLKANNLKDAVEVKEVEEIREEDLPFEKQAGRPTGATITTPAGEQIVLIAYGADSETGYHEGYHVLRSRLTPKDRAVLDKHFKGDEEAEARAFAVFAKTGKAAKSYLRAIWEKLLRILRKIKSGLQAKGFRTAKDIFGEVLTGRVAKEAPSRARTQFETTGEKWRREAERRAHINAEKARLKARIVPKKKTPQLKRLKIKIDEKATPILSRELGKEPGGMKKRPPQKGKVLSDVEATQFLRDDLATPTVIPAQPLHKAGRGVPTPRLTQQWFDFHTDDEAMRIMGRVSQETKDIIDKAGRLVWSSSTILYNIHPELFRRMREYELRWMRRTANMLGVVEPFLKKFRRLRKTNPRDWKQLDKALKNSAAWKVDQLVDKHNMAVEYRAAREVYEELYYGAKQVGMDMRYRGDYWHREVKNKRGFIEHFYQTEHWSPISQALKTRAARGGREVGDLTEDEKAQVINTLLRGYQTQAVQLLRPGATKERLVPEVDKSINQYYYDSGSALVRYIRQMNQAIAQREFFGRETRAVQKVRAQLSRRISRLIKYKNQEGLREGASVEDYKEAEKLIAESIKASQERLERLGGRDLTQTIGGYVGKLKDHGYITPLQEGQVQKIISGILQPARMGKILGTARTLMYLDTLNSFFQAITQLDEFAYAFLISPSGSIPAAIKTILRRNPVTLRDIGVVAPGVEFQEPNLKRALGAMLQVTGFRAIDVFGKETLINTALKDYQKQASKKKPSKKFVNQMIRVFGPNQYKQVIDELKQPIGRADEVSDNIAFLLFNVAADRQPISHSEMPEPYNTSGNGRMFYTLKTFYLKRLDFIRNQVWEDMKNPKTFLRGFTRLIWILAAWAAFGAGSDALKDFIKGKPIRFKDYVWDNLLKFIFMSKYAIYKARTEGVGRTAVETLLPPTKVIDAATKDILTIAEDKDRGFELWRSVPIAGEPYYWWLGEGRRKIEEKQGETGWPVD